MNDVVCSVLIPSRSRFGRLKETIRSVLESSSGSAEVLVKFDDDDIEAKDRLHELDAFGWRLRTVFSPRKIERQKSGYQQLNLFYMLLALVARGQWIWIMNDDAVVKSSKPWDAQLLEVPSARLVQPEIVWLGASRYERTEATAFPIIRNEDWIRYPPHILKDPADIQLHQVFCEREQWLTWFLEGLEVFHERDRDEELAAHRL